MVNGRGRKAHQSPEMSVILTMHGFATYFDIDEGRALFNNVPILLLMDIKRAFSVTLYFKN